MGRGERGMQGTVDDELESAGEDRDGSEKEVKGGGGSGRYASNIDCAMFIFGHIRDKGLFI